MGGTRFRLARYISLLHASCTRSAMENARGVATIDEKNTLTHAWVAAGIQEN